MLYSIVIHAISLYYIMLKCYTVLLHYTTLYLDYFCINTDKH